MGTLLGQHGLVAKGPFHYEDRLRIPMIVRWPGQVPAGKISSAIQSLVDLTPSFLDAAGLGAPEHLQGISQIPVWKDEVAEVRDFALCENRHNPHVVSYIGKRYKVTVYKASDFGELFDLEKDPNEIYNLWNAPEAADTKRALFAIYYRILSRE